MTPHDELMALRAKALGELDEILVQGVSNVVKALAITYGQACSVVAEQIGEALRSAGLIPPDDEPGEEVDVVPTHVPARRKTITRYG